MKMGLGKRDFILLVSGLDFGGRWVLRVCVFDDDYGTAIAMGVE